MPIPPAKQLPLSKKDHDRLVYRIRDDYSAYSADLGPRKKAMERWYRLWRNAVDPNGFPAEERSNFSIPLILWVITAKVAKEMDILFGEESEVVVMPIGESDAPRAEKIKKWMTWRVKNSLKLFKPYYRHLVQKHVQGLSPLSVQWVTRLRREKKFVPVLMPVQQEVIDPRFGLPALVTIPMPQIEEQEVDVVEFDGPEVTVENLEDWVFPARSTDIVAGDFIRNLWLSIDQILDLRDRGILDATYVAECLEELKRLAKQGGSVPTGDVTDEKAAQSGVGTQPQGRPEKVVVYNWFGKFRLNVKDDETGGDERATDLIAFYQPEKNKLLGVCRRIDIYPDGLQHFIMCEASLDHNSAYGIGSAEKLEPISNELDDLHRIAVDAGKGAVGPVIVYEPASGFDPEKFKLEPFAALPVASAAGVKAINLGNIQLAPYTILMQMLQAFAERVTSINDPQMGRQSSQPNAPRTFGQQQMLQNESNVNLLLDIRLERENFRKLLHLIWELDKRYLAKPVFFRVTETDPLDVMTNEDMQGDYDFDIGPVTSISNKEQKTQELMQAFSVSAQLMMPVVMIALFKKLLTRLGQADVAALLPNVEAMRPPMDPNEENTRMLQGEVIEPTPLDPHPQHIAVHQALIQQIQSTQIAGISLAEANPGAIPRIQAHIAKHEVAAKALMGLAAGMMLGPGMMGGGQEGGGDEGGGGPVPNSGPEQNPFAGAQADNASMLNQGSLNIA